MSTTIVESPTLREGSIPMTAAEHEAVVALAAGPGRLVSLTRRDPGETGPVLVRRTAFDRDEVHEVSGDGRVTRVG